MSCSARSMLFKTFCEIPALTCARILFTRSITGAPTEHSEQAVALSSSYEQFLAKIPDGNLFLIRNMLIALLPLYTVVAFDTFRTL
ncbi:unnamed protein product [Enterobius vermicularis]|uniref:ABC transmembrane type-1 domain-containing protein n=1 Tax=Enterobius vermicularis TaxID=51028 RepID=A0A0N4V1T5_ENTVE|nr:unnamed protein product [Enterobius vermicularis]